MERNSDLKIRHPKDLDHVLKNLAKIQSEPGRNKWIKDNLI